MYNVDLILTLWDRTEGHAIYNSQIVPKILEFVNYPCRTVVQLDQPTEKNLQILNNLKNEGKIQEIHIANHPSDHRPIDINNIYMQAFSHIKNKWVVHFDGDMLFYRKGHDNWLEKFIQIIEQKKHNIGAICHSAPSRNDDWTFRKTFTTLMKLEWVSTRFFITEDETVLAAMKSRDISSNATFEGIMWKERLSNWPHPNPPRDDMRLKSITIPFDPDFLIVHIEQLLHWKEDSWNTYIREFNNRNDTLLKNVMSSNYGDIEGDMRDIREENRQTGGWNKIIYNDKTFISLFDI